MGHRKFRLDVPKNFERHCKYQRPVGRPRKKVPPTRKVVCETEASSQELPDLTSTSDQCSILVSPVAHISVSDSAASANTVPNCESCDDTDGLVTRERSLSPSSVSTMLSSCSLRVQGSTALEPLCGNCGKQPIQSSDTDLSVPLPKRSRC